MSETDVHTTEEEVVEQVVEKVNEEVAALDEYYTATTFPEMEQEILNVPEDDDDMSFDEQLSALLQYQSTASTQDAQKFLRIRTCMMKLNEDFEETLLAREHQHQEEIKLCKEEVMHYKEVVKRVSQAHEEEIKRREEEMKRVKESHEQEMKRAGDSHQEEMKRVNESHEAELKRVSEELSASGAKNEVLGYKIKTLMAHEQENAILLKRSSEKIKKLEATEENHKAYVKMAGERISAMESQAKARAERAEEKIRMMEVREEKVLALAKKAALKIKDLETYKKKQTANAKIAVQNIQTLKEMLLSKQKDMLALKDKALKEYEGLAQALAKAQQQRAELQAAVAQTKQQYKKEHEMRKSDQKKISSLRRMIEQYDGGVEPAWSELSQAMSEEEDLTNPLTLYRNSTYVDQDQFDAVKEDILNNIPEETRVLYRQVGFFNANGYHFPVLALGPFDVPPGSLREKWLEKANSSLGVYCFGQEDVSLAYDMIPTESFIPYEDGVENNFHILPACILEKNISGAELSPIEEVLKEGINKANAEAHKMIPEDRYHPLNNFEEEFAQVMEEDNNSVVVIEELRSKFKETICASFSNCEDLPGEIDNIVVELNKMKDHAKALERKKKLTVDVDADCDNQSCASGASLDTDCAETTTSIEEQMQKFMVEMAKSKAALTPMTPYQPSSPRKLGASPRTFVPPVQQETVASTNDETAEVRDDAPESTQASSLVQQRLKMFGSNKTKAPRPAVIPERGAKNVMKMWQMKAAGKNVQLETATPKQANTTPAPTAGSFSFGDDKQAESPEVKVVDEPKTRTSVAEQPEQPGQSKTRCVTIPKNILKKIEAGEALTDEERDVLESIQKVKKTGEVQVVEVDDDSVEGSTSFVSGVTIDGSCADGMEVTME